LFAIFCIKYVVSKIKKSILRSFQEYASKQHNFEKYAYNFQQHEEKQQAFVIATHKQ
jgi:hypothetical protein